MSFNQPQYYMPYSIPTARMPVPLPVNNQMMPGAPTQNLGCQAPNYGGAPAQFIHQGPPIHPHQANLAPMLPPLQPIMAPTPPPQLQSTLPPLIRPLGELPPIERRMETMQRTLVQALHVMQGQRNLLERLVVVTTANKIGDQVKGVGPMRNNKRNRKGGSGGKKIPPIGLVSAPIALARAPMVADDNATSAAAQATEPAGTGNAASSA